MSEYETDPEEYTLEKTITFFSIGEYTHCSKALSRYVAEQLKRIAELEAANETLVGGSKVLGQWVEDKDKRIAELEDALLLIRDSTYRNAMTLRAMADRALSVQENNDDTQCSSNDLLENNDD